MANARALDKRRKSIRNIRKITRTMELIATARYKKAMERAAAVAAYTDRLSQIVNSLAASGAEVAHPLLQQLVQPQASEESSSSPPWTQSTTIAIQSAIAKPSRKSFQFM